MQAINVTLIILFLLFTLNTLIAPFYSTKVLPTFFKKTKRLFTNYENIIIILLVLSVTYRVLLGIGQPNLAHLFSESTLLLTNFILFILDLLVAVTMHAIKIKIKIVVSNHVIFKYDLYEKHPFVTRHYRLLEIVDNSLVVLMLMVLILYTFLYI